ncbi:hypothetical protein M8J76_005343 [Diaphorina citri]|nr:hypothetical protein M8J76_005343 [Diaphorina citri]
MDPNNVKDIPMEVDDFQSSGLSAQFSAELDRVALAIAIRGLEFLGFLSMPVNEDSNFLCPKQKQNI